MRRRCSSRWRLAVAACVALASPLPFASGASAGALATLHAIPQQVQAGGTITVFGRNYSSNAAASDIEIRLDGREGPVVASFSPRSTIGDYQRSVGQPYFLVGEPVTIPASTSVGSHTLVATQRTTRGEMISGGPGRTTIEVTASRSTASAAPAAAPAPAEPAASPARIVADRLAGGARPPLLLAVGFSLLALLVAMRQRRRPASCFRSAG